MLLVKILDIRYRNYPEKLELFILMLFMDSFITAELFCRLSALLYFFNMKNKI